jgi:hypothetical protein
VPAAHVVVTLERDGVLDVLERIDVDATAPYAARREIAMQQGELFADPSVYVDGRRLKAGDGKTPRTFRVSQGAHGIRFDWRQPAGAGSVRLGYRLALLGTAYSDVVDLRVPAWAGDWQTGVRDLSAAVSLPRPAHGPLLAWAEPRSLPARITKTSRTVGLRTRNVPAGTRVTLHVVFPRAVVSSVAGLNTKDRPGLQSILAARNGDGRRWWVWALVAAAAALGLVLTAGALRAGRSPRPRRR